MNLNNLTLDMTGQSLTLRSAEVARSSKLMKLGDAYAEFAKLVFLFDVSGSMKEMIAKTFTDQFAFTPSVVEDIRQRVTAAVAGINAFMLDPTAPELENADALLKMTDDSRGPNGEHMFTATDEELKERVVRKELTGFFGVGANFMKSQQKMSSRMSVVKKLAKQELAARFTKFPDSRIAVIPFGDHPEVMFDDGAPADLWPKLEELHVCMGNCGGGTDILGAIRCGMEVCRAKPSSVGVHHFILVSDGEDYVASANIGSWVPSLKASGIVLDYIHIGDETANKGLAAACKATGGEMVTVNTERDLEIRFVEAMNRLMLPPPTEK